MSAMKDRLLSEEQADAIREAFAWNRIALFLRYTGKEEELGVSQVQAIDLRDRCLREAGLVGGLYPDA